MSRRNSGRGEMSNFCCQLQRVGESDQKTSHRWADSNIIIYKQKQDTIHHTQIRKTTSPNVSEIS